MTDAERIAALESQLAAANERCAGLAAALDRLRKNALEMAGYVKPYGLDDAGPQSEWSRYIQCRSNIENVADPSAILAAVREKAKMDGYRCAVAVLDDLLLNCCLPPLGPDEGFRQGLLRLIEWEVKVALDPQVSTEAVRLKREGAVEELYRWAHWGEDIRRRIAALEGKE